MDTTSEHQDLKQNGGKTLDTHDISVKLTEDSNKGDNSNYKKGDNCTSKSNRCVVCIKLFIALLCGAVFGICLHNGRGKSKSFVSLFRWFVTSFVSTVSSCVRVLLRLLAHSFDCSCLSFTFVIKNKYKKCIIFC